MIYYNWFCIIIYDLFSGILKPFNSNNAAAPTHGGGRGPDMASLRYHNNAAQDAARRLAASKIAADWSVRGARAALCWRPQPRAVPGPGSGPAPAPCHRTGTASALPAGLQRLARGGESPLSQQSRARRFFSALWGLVGWGCGSSAEAPGGREACGLCRGTAGAFNTRRARGVLAVTRPRCPTWAAGAAPRRPRDSAEPGRWGGTGAAGRARRVTAASAPSGWFFGFCV